MVTSATILAFDVGLKRTGVAVGQALTGSANPCTTIKVAHGRHDWLALDHLIREWQPSAIVLGDPQTQDPHLRKAINRLKSYIQQQHKLPLVEINERLSSAAASSELQQHSLSVEQKTELRDQIAACLILETYFHSLSDSAP